MFFFHDWNESSKLNVAVKRQAAKLVVPKDKHKKFLKNASTIANEIIKAMDDADSIFKNDFRQLRQTASFTNGKFMDLPGDLNFHLLFKFPFNVKIVRNSDISVENFTPERLQASANHPIVKDGFVDIEIFESLLQNDIKKAIDNIKSVDCKGKLYNLSYEFSAQLASYSIIAKEQTTDNDNVAYISFDFVPAIDLGKNYAISLRHDCFPRSREVTGLLHLADCERKQNIVDVLRLLRHIFVVNGEATQSTCLALKDAYFSKLLQEGIKFIECPLGAQLYNFFRPENGNGDPLFTLISQSFSMTGVIRPSVGPLKSISAVSFPVNFKLRFLQCKHDHENCDKLIDEIFLI